jgi:hypothetical protein
MVDDSIREESPFSGDSPIEYESPLVHDLGSVFEVTRGSSSGGSDSNGQGLY